MKIILSPQARPDRLVLFKEGDKLVFNGESVLVRDFLCVEEHDHPWIAGPVIEIDGEIQVQIILPHGPDAPETTRFPDPITVAVDGQVALPSYSRNGSDT